MRSKVPDIVEKSRIHYKGGYAGEFYGAFIIKCGTAHLRVICGLGDKETWPFPGEPWDHVSVSLEDRTPTWDEMCHVKSLFFDDEETVVQFHPPKSVYVNNHPHVLHLWRPTETVIPLPPIGTV